MTGADFLAARRRLGYTQIQMARALGVDPQTVSRWERSERPIAQTVEILVRLLLDQGGPVSR